MKIYNNKFTLLIFTFIELFDIIHITQIELTSLKIDILAIICSKYWCDGIKKIEFINRLDINDEIKQEKLNENYDSSKLFKNIKTINTEKELGLIENKQNFFTKVLKFLKFRKD